MLLFPIVIFELYLNFGLLLFFFGPLDYQVLHPVLLPLYLIAAHVCLYLGYRTAIRRQPKAYSGVIPVKLLIWLSIISVFVVALIRLIPAVDSIADIPRAIFAALMNLSLAYHEKFEIDVLFGVQRYMFWCFAFAPLMVPLVVAYWKRLSGITKISAVLVLFWDIVYWIVVGTTKGIADACILLPLMVVCGYPHFFIRRLSARKKILLGTTAIMGVLITIMFFSNAKGTHELDLNQVAIGSVVRYESLNGLPTWLGASSTLLTGYMVQGYHGLDLSFSQPFVWAYGGGHSPFFLGPLIQDAQGNTALSLSYPFRIDASEGWEPLGNWHSIYPWIASDITFSGTLLFVFSIGFLYGLAWIDWLIKKNPLAFAMFYQLSLILLYFPCNNFQILGDVGVLGFVAWLTIWLFTRTNSLFVDPMGLQL